MEVGSRAKRLDVEPVALRLSYCTVVAHFWAAVPASEKFETGGMPVSSQSTAGS